MLNQWKLPVESEFSFLVQEAFGYAFVGVDAAVA